MCSEVANLYLTRTYDGGLMDKWETCSGQWKWSKMFRSPIGDLNIFFGHPYLPPNLPTHQPAPLPFPAHGKPIPIHVSEGFQWVEYRLATSDPRVTCDEH